MLGYYINLNERVDRKKHFESIKKKYDFFKNITRLEAIKNNNGAIGCGLSHIKALTKLKELAKDNSLNYVCVIEDDFCILSSDNFLKFINDFKEIENNNNWDIIVLTPRGVTMKERINNFKRINNNQTTSGYIIKVDMIDILIDNFKNALNGLFNPKNNENTYAIYAIDQYWKKLQNTYKFFYYSNIFAGQLPGYSSIERRNVNYNNRFIMQNKY